MPQSYIIISLVIIIFIETAVIIFFLRRSSKARFRKKVLLMRRESGKQKTELLRYKTYNDAIDLMKKPIKKVSIDYYHTEGSFGPLIINYLIVETNKDYFTFNDIKIDTIRMHYPLLHTFIAKALNKKDNEVIMD